MSAAGIGSDDLRAARVGVVFVSHSAKIAAGLVELAGQMAPATTLVAAGGTDADELGTSFERVSGAMVAADGGRGVVVLCDLGSAILTAETALDFLDDELRTRVRIVDAPLVEGGVAAAVAAEIGGDLEAVAAAAEGADRYAPAPHDGDASPATMTDDSGAVTRTATLVNTDGLHARPAADFVRLASTFSAQITVNDQDATSLLGIMGLGLTIGTSARISAVGTDAEAAVTALTELIESGFGE
ncbi:dihydroxyacetone kinase phosphoryl donor subunit DhaM [Cryobacterium frigoriphilum]|uniref:dihydroxyacetone kinase phosphoryl donor subunit DhaM n=1 Tax=Cryobacterium frigoriphilum TaxID=1259150 RepID=UPI001F5434C6|nr:dihydroxyacetone kinase phosphoryl donor subunit DhaM [Cryobacterium frigoriphilum]